MKSKNKIPVVTVITVVFNDEDNLENTILSIINQDYSCLEFIVIDGGSTDRTLDIIKKYEDKIDVFISEEDAGIYDAMNKGLNLMTGDWVNFMNSGDTFYSLNTLKKVFELSDLDEVDIVFGNNEVVYPNKKRIAKSGLVKNLPKGSQFSHQSSFVRSSLHKEKGFNISNTISADFEFFYNQMKVGRKFKKIEGVISSVSSGGVSDLNRIDSIVSWWNVVEKKDSVNFYYLFLILKEVLKSKIKRYIVWRS